MTTPLLINLQEAPELTHRRIMCQSPKEAELELERRGGHGGVSVLFWCLLLPSCSAVHESSNLKSVIKTGIMMPIFCTLYELHEDIIHVFKCL